MMNTTSTTTPAEPQHPRGSGVDGARMGVDVAEQVGRRLHTLATQLPDRLRLRLAHDGVDGEAVNALVAAATARLAAGMLGVRRAVSQQPPRPPCTSEQEADAYLAAVEGAVEALIARVATDVLADVVAARDAAAASLRAWNRERPVNQPLTEQQIQAAMAARKLDVTIHTRDEERWLEEQAERAVRQQRLSAEADERRAREAARDAERRAAAERRQQVLAERIGHLLTDDGRGTSSRGETETE